MRRSFPATLFTCCLLLTIPAFAQTESKPPRERIGEVLGKGVYRDEIRTGNGIRIEDELHRLFAQPVIAVYRLDHLAEITPTEDELRFAEAVFDRQHRESLKKQGNEEELRAELDELTKRLNEPDFSAEEKQKTERRKLFLEAKLTPPGRFFASFMVSHRKFQQHLYRNYGGGRILWQQGGVEAFDAMHQWLQSLESKKQFVIDDPALRTAFYQYWTTQSHGSFLTADEHRIRTEFLEPDWLPPPTPPTAK